MGKRLGGAGVREGRSRRNPGQWNENIGSKNKTKPIWLARTTPIVSGLTLLFAHRSAKFARNPFTCHTSKIRTPTSPLPATHAKNRGVGGRLRLTSPPTHGHAPRSRRCADCASLSLTAKGGSAS